MGRQQKVSGADSQQYGEYVNNGDILGCALDLENKTLQYWLNGKDWGVAFTNVVPGMEEEFWREELTFPLSLQMAED